MARQRPGIDYCETSKMLNASGAASRNHGWRIRSTIFPSTCQSLVRLGGLDQRKCFRDRDFELSGGDSDIESLEFADAGNPVIGYESYAPSFLRCRSDRQACLPVAAFRGRVRTRRRPSNARIASSPSGAKRRAASATSSCRASTAKIGAHVAHEFQAVDAGRGREHAGETKLSELDGERPNTARGAVNDNGLAALYREHIVNALQRGQPGGWNCAGVFQIEVCRNMGDFVRRNGDIFCIKTAFGIGLALGVGLVSGL
jgi:hypothetical protein